jgi:hypothetical protein
VSQNIEAIAGDVSYEWDMLRWTYEKLRYEEGELLLSEVTDPQILTEFWFGTSHDDRLHSAMLESFLLHARTLRDFFLDDKKKRPDDVLAGDFFEVFETWTEARPSLGPYLSQNKKRLDKSLAHISYARLDFKVASKWDISAVLRELDLIWQTFLKTLSPERRRWFWAS